MNYKSKSAFYKFLLNHPEIMNNQVTVEGNSMYPMLVHGQKVKIDNNKNNINIGDIILYRYYSNHLTIHRIVGIIIKNEKVYYQTKGDNNEHPDDYLISKEDIIGKLIW